MATYTSNLNLKKPALDDDALITDINNNMDILDAAANGIEDALAIVANGNTHAAITSGQFVYVRNHNTLTEGLYVASSNIAANAALSSSNLTADSKGGLNALSEQIVTLQTISDINDSSHITWTKQGTNVSFRKNGNGVYSLIYGNLNNNNYSNGDLIATISDGYRPYQSMYSQVFDEDAGKPADGTVFISSNDGTIKYYGVSLSSKKIRFSGVWIRS